MGRTRRIAWIVGIAAVAALASAPAWAAPEGLGGRIHRAIWGKLLPDLTDAQRGELRRIRDAFIEEAKAHAQPLRGAVRAFLEKVDGTLTDEQKQKAREVGRRLHDLPGPEKLATALRFLRSLDSKALRNDVIALIEGDAARQRKAGERVARRVGNGLIRRAGKEIGLDKAQAGAIRKAFAGLLKETREARRAIQEIAGKKLGEACAVLTDAQKERIEGAKARVLEFLRQAPERQKRARAQEGERPRKRGRAGRRGRAGKRRKKPEEGGEKPGE